MEPAVAYQALTKVPSAPWVACPIAISARTYGLSGPTSSWPWTLA